MAQKIHQYLLERFTFGDDDYFDIDYFDGVSYQTAKIKGSTIKAGIQSGITGINVYNANGTLEGNRTIDGDASTYGLTIDNLSGFVVDNTGIFEAKIFPPSFLTTEKAINFEVDPTNISGTTPRLLQIKDSNANVIRFMVTTDGKIIVNESYTLPNVDGNANDVLTTDGAGNVTFQPSGSAVNIYNTNGTLTGDRILNGDNSQYYLILNEISFLGAVINPPVGLTDSGVKFEIDPTNIQTGTGAMLRIVDSNASVDRLNVVKDGTIIVNESYTLPNTGGGKNDFLVVTNDNVGGADTIEFKEVYNIASSQWNTTAPTTAVNTGTTFNLLSLLDETTDKSASGTSSYDEYILSFGISITLSGTSGTADIVVGGNTYTATFNTDLFTTAQDWVNANQSVLNAGGYQVFALGSGTDGRIRFGATTDTGLNAITITNVTGDLDGTIANEFTGSLTADYDHIVIPYEGQPYENLRLQHYLRTNFNIDTAGQESYVKLQLRRWQNDTQIGSDIPIRRYLSAEGITGQQHVFETYTNSPTDSFVTGGFYLAIQNDDQNIDLSGSTGLLVQTNYEKPLYF